MIFRDKIKEPKTYFEISSFQTENNIYFSSIDMNEILLKNQGCTIAFFAKKITSKPGYILNFKSPFNLELSQVAFYNQDINTQLVACGSSLEDIERNVVERNIASAEWNHYCFTTEKKGLGYSLKIYFNGVLARELFEPVNPPIRSYLISSHNQEFEEGEYLPAHCFYSDFLVFDKTLSNSEIIGLTQKKELDDSLRVNTLIHFKDEQNETVQDFNFYRKTNNSTTFDAEFQSVERFNSGILRMETLVEGANTLVGMSNQRTGINYNEVDYAYNMNDIANELRWFESGTLLNSINNYQHWHNPYYLEKTSTEMKYYTDKGDTLQRSVADTTDKIVDVKLRFRTLGEFITLDNSKITPTNVTNVTFFTNQKKNYAKEYNDKFKPKNILIDL